MPIMSIPEKDKAKELADTLSGTMNPDKNYDEMLLKKTFTQDTFHNRTAMNTSRFDPIIKKLQTYASGSPIKVIYYSQIHNFANKQSHTSDYSANLNQVNKCYDRINDFEIRLSGELTTSVDDETGETSVEGTGKIIAGFCPNVGDIFLYEMFPGQLALFLVSGVTPLALYREAAYETTFILKEYVSNETLAKFEECTVNVYYFTKQSVLGESVVVLNKTDYLDFQKILGIRKELIHYYVDIYYYGTHNTFYRPDGVYDPYVIKFFNSLVSFEDTAVSPVKQLCTHHEHNIQNIWDDFTEETKRFNYHKSVKYRVTRKSFNLLSAGINALHNRSFILLTKTDEDLYYVFSEFFYKKEVLNPSLTPFELFVLNYLDTKSVAIPTLLTFIDGIHLLDPLEAFYRIPIIIHLCNKIIVNL